MKFKNIWCESNYPFGMITLEAEFDTEEEADAHMDMILNPDSQRMRRARASMSFIDDGFRGD